MYYGSSTPPASRQLTLSVRHSNLESIVRVSNQFHLCISINQKQIAKLANIHAPSHIPPSSYTCKPFEAGTTFPSDLCTDLRQWSHNPALGFLAPAGVLISFLRQNNICSIPSTVPLVRARHPGKDQSLVSNPEAYTEEYHLLTFLLVVLISYILDLSLQVPHCTATVPQWDYSLWLG